MREFFTTQVDTHVDTVETGVESTVDEASLHHPRHVDKHVDTVETGVESTVDEASLHHTKWNAAYGGHLDCLVYAHEHDAPWDILTCSCAASGGHLDCLRYAHEHGAPWDTSTCSNAAGGGHIDCLRYAHEHGAPWDTSTCTNAAYGGISIAFGTRTSTERQDGRPPGTLVDHQTAIVARVLVHRAIKLLARPEAEEA